MHKSGMVEIVEGVVQMGGDAVKVGASSYGGGMGVFALRNLRQWHIYIITLILSWLINMHYSLQSTC